MRFLFCLLLIVTPVAARQNDAPVVEVFIPPLLGSLTDLAFRRARNVVADTFSEIGLTVEWRSPKPQITGCSKTPMRRNVVVALSWHTPPDFHPAALAFSNPYSAEGACVTIFVDRVKPMVQRNPFTTGYLLGHVLTHEIAHVLQGIARHSETGMLKEQWSISEIKNMPYHPLQFTPFDAELILDSFHGITPEAR